MPESDELSIKVKRNERALFVGRTNSGKTTLAKGMLGLLGSKGRYAVLDPKNRYTPPEGVSIVRKYSPRTTQQVVREPFGAHVQQAYDETMRAVFRQQQRTLVYVDEVTLITPLRPVALAYGALIRQGREIGIGVWSATQRPKEIPAICYTESEHFFIFQLNDRNDRKRVVEFTGDKVAEQIDTIKGHEFLYYNVMDDTCQKMILKF